VFTSGSTWNATCVHRLRHSVPSCAPSVVFILLLELVVSETTVKRNPLMTLAARVRSQEFARFLKFAIVGGSGVVVNMGMLWLGKVFIFNAMSHQSAIAWAGFFAIAISILTNFLLNDGWTWSDRRADGVRAFLVRMGKYVLVASVAGVVQWLILQGFVHVGVHYLLSNLVGIAAGIVMNYCANNWWTFRSIAEE